jgi:hypothetical protein
MSKCKGRLHDPGLPAKVSSIRLCLREASSERSRRISFAATGKAVPHGSRSKGDRKVEGNLSKGGRAEVDLKTGQ